MGMILFIKTIVLGIVEGLTEFFPVSSTAHLLIANKLLHMPDNALTDVLTIAIQSGAMLAAIFFFWKTVWRSLSLIPKLIVAFIPTAVVGLLLSGFVQSLLSASLFTALALILGGIVFLILKTNDELAPPLDTISYREAFSIGVSQILAIIPGVSRSGATLIGGSLANIPRERIVAFSFLLAIPTIFGATAVELWKAPSLQASEWFLIVVGTLIAFGVALCTMKWALRILSTKPLKWFGWYRIAIGILLILFLVLK